MHRCTVSLLEGREDKNSRRSNCQIFGPTLEGKTSIRYSSFLSPKYWVKWKGKEEKKCVLFFANICVKMMIKILFYTNLTLWNSAIDGLVSMAIDIFCKASRKRPVRLMLVDCCLQKIRINNI